MAPTLVALRTALPPEGRISPWAPRFSMRVTRGVLQKRKWYEAHCA